ncbi:MAG: hypothetical protein DCC75_01330 [Proteobacteria bacterium]|nr:MAG: hypothetical protein DCC75_01330 [Pseudomonadota bacterium]
MFARSFKALTVAFSALALTSCGGGTSGTDTGGVRLVVIQGSVTNQGAALSGLQVSVLESGDSSATDQSGSFSIQTALETQDATLLVEGQGINSQVTINEIPPQDSKVDLALSLDSNSNQLEVVSITVTLLEEQAPIDQTPAPGAPGQGGSGGSGNEQEEIAKSIFKGVIRSGSGRPLPGVTIRIVQTGASGRSNNQGRFTIESQVIGSPIRIEANLGGVTVSTVLTGIPRRPVEVEMSLVLSGIGILGASGPSTPDLKIDSSRFRLR